MPSPFFTAFLTSPPGRRLLRIPADLGPLRSAVLDYLALGYSVALNGDVFPRPETDAAHRRIEAQYKALVLPMIAGVNEAQVRVSVRIKGLGKLDNGSYASSKLHSDVWSGNPPGVIVMIPIEGDIERGGVEFFEATQGFEALNKVYGDYAHAPDFAPRSLGRMEPGKVHFVDCLHRTLPGDLRVSVDHRFAYKRVACKRMGNYVPLDQWRTMT